MHGRFTNQVEANISCVPRSYQQGKRWGLRRSREHNGYIEDWCPVRERYVYQHRLVIEREIGRFLERRERVHHKNGNTTDNRRSNLAHCADQAEHIAHHLAEGTWTGKGKPRPSMQKPKVPCAWCGQLFKPTRRTNGAGEQVDVRCCSLSCGQLLRYRAVR